MLHLRADTLDFTLPQSWGEITYGQFSALQTSTDTRTAMLILSGKTDADFRPLRTPDLDTLVARHLAFLSAVPDITALPVPSALRVGGKTIAVPKDLGKQTTYGQRCDIEHVLKNLPSPEREADTDETDTDESTISLLDVADTLLSVYLCPLITGTPYDGLDHAETTLFALREMACTELLPVAAFFLSSYASPSPSGRISFRTVRKGKANKAARFAWPAALRRVLSILTPTFRSVR